MYHNQEGVVRGDSSTSRWFNIFAGNFRQGLSPRLFCAVLQTAFSEWRQSVASFGLDFGDGLPELRDLRFADDLLLFARSAQDAAKLFDDLVRCCSGVGLRLNVTKTKIVTSEAQAPAQLLTCRQHRGHFTARCVTQVVGLFVVQQRFKSIFCGCGLSFAGCFQSVFCKQTNSP